MLEARVVRPEVDGVSAVEVRQRFRGRTGRHVLEVHRGEDRLLQKGIEGWPSWQCDWHFRPAPRGGTTVTLELELELGMMGLLSPRRWIQDFARTLFQDTLANARRELRGTAHAPGGEGEVLFALYETPEGLELLLDGEVYTVRPKA
jgi:hypothetical protein